MKTVNFKEIDFSERLNTRISSEGKLKLIPIEVKIDIKDFVKIVDLRRRSIREQIKEAKEYIKSYYETRGTIYNLNLPMTEEYYKDQLKKLEEYYYHLTSTYMSKNIGYNTNEEFILEPAKNEQERKNLNKYLNSFYSEFISNIFKTISIPGFVLGIDRLKLINIKPKYT